MGKDDPQSPHAQRELLYRKTGDRYWREKDEISKEEAGKQFAKVPGTPAKTDTLEGCKCLNVQDKALLMLALEAHIDEAKRNYPVAAKELLNRIIRTPVCPYQPKLKGG